MKHFHRLLRPSVHRLLHSGPTTPIAISHPTQVSATQTPSPPQTLTPITSSSNPLHLLTASDPRLFHRSLTVHLRPPGKRARKRLRHADVIPTTLRGRGHFDDVLLQLDPKPLNKDYTSYLYCFQRLGRWLLQTPLYELRLQPTPLDHLCAIGDNPPPSPDDILPFQRVRVIGKCVQIHPLKDALIGLQFNYAPENEPVRVRLPIYPINQENAPGLRDGGWLNRLHWNIEVRVEPYVIPPLFAQVDVGHLKMKEKVCVGDLVFDGKGEGVSTLLSDDVPTTMVSKL